MNIEIKMNLFTFIFLVCLTTRCEAFRTFLSHSLGSFPFPPSLPEAQPQPVNQKELQNVRQHTPEEPNTLRETHQEFQQKEVKEATRQTTAVEGAQHGAEVELSQGEGSQEPAGPGEEKEEKARSKGSFVSDGSQEAGEIFSEASMQEGGVGADQSLRDFKKQVLEGIASNAPARQITEKDLQELRDLDKEPTDRPAECLRDYSSQCPESFVAISTECRATDSYKGPCAKIQKDLYKLTDEEKRSWTVACGDSWPCMLQACEKGTDYDKCPIGWTQKGEGVCQASDDYDKCERLVQFGLYTNEGKRDFENRCNVRWPCNSMICQRDFSTVCPENWTHNGNFICEAPLSYGGPCPKFANMTDYVDRQDLKKNFEIVCLTQWPCVSAITSDVCERNFDVSCPLGWLPLDDGSCKAPYTYQYTRQCSSVVTFKSIAVADRASFAAECEVDFPCKDRTKCKDIDLSSRCPISWIDTGDGKSCLAPKEYDGPCDTVIPFGDMSDGEKTNQISTCAVEWPCVGEWRGSFLFMHVEGPQVTKALGAGKQVISTPKLVSIRRLENGPVAAATQKKS